MNKYLFSSCLLFFTILQAKEERLFYELIAQENIKTFSFTDQSGIVLASRNKFYDVLKTTLHDQLYPSQEAKRRLVFTLLQEHERKEKLSRTFVLDATSWKDLEIVCGPRSSAQTYLAEKINRTSTEIGRIVLYRTLLQPTAHVAFLKSRQALLKSLLYNNELYTKLDTLLQTLVIPENALLSLWDPHDIFWKMIEKEEITIPFQDKSPSLYLLHQWLDTNPFVNELHDKSYIFTLMMRGITMGISTLTLPLYTLSFFAQRKCPWLEDFNRKLGVGGALGLATFSGAFYYGLNKVFPSKFTEIGSNLTAGITAQVSFSNIIRNIRIAFTFNKCIQEKCIHIATYFNGLTTIASLLKDDPFWSKSDIMPWLEIEHCGKEITSLIHLFSTATFQGSASFFSYTGRVIAAYKILHRHKNKVLQALVALGELDMHLSIARLYKEFEHEQVHFCFPDYKEDAQTPYIAINNFWNPLVHPKVAVPNSLLLGDTVRNCVITGPNAGGKSTTLKAVIIAVIFGQTIGIVPAETTSFTPFSSITTYLHITDDIAAGNSLFKAGVLRARELLTRVENLKENEFSLSGIDEVFNGTMYQEGQAAAYVLLKTLGAKKNNICVTATHFPLITRLAQENTAFANYKVSVVVKEGHKIYYPYLLEPGISDQVITFQVLKEEGFSDSFLAEAQEMVEQAKCIIQSK